MKNINKIYYKDIKNLLLGNQIDPVSNFTDNDYFLSINSLNKSTNNDLTFFSNISQMDNLSTTKAKGCLIQRKYINSLPKKTQHIVVENPYKAFALISNLFANKQSSSGIISNYSIIDKNSKLYDNIQIDSFVNIKENCTIHNNVIIESNCTIGPNVIISDNSIIRSNTTISNCNIGSSCIIKSGSIIGGSGFGFDPISKTKVNHFGNVSIGNNCYIGSCTTIDRAVFDSTTISDNCYIDNLVQIAHNVIIGKDAIIAAQCGIAGSTLIGNNVVIGGQAGISGHLVIGNNVQIAAKSGVTKNIKNNSVVAGFPAIDIKKWKLANIKLNKL